MRLWHKDLIPFLPEKQLKGQWRECCLIAKGIAEHGTPNHLLVNKVLEYPSTHFLFYCDLIIEELKNRGYLVRKNAYDTLVTNLKAGVRRGAFNQFKIDNNLYSEWMTNRSLIQCYYNLQEKYDCGGITEEEWKRIKNNISEF